MKQTEHKVTTAILIFLTIVLSPLLIASLEPAVLIIIFVAFVGFYGMAIIFTEFEPVKFSLITTYFVWILVFVGLSYEHITNIWDDMFTE